MKRIIRPILGFLIACLLFCAVAVPSVTRAEPVVRELIPGGMAFGVKYYSKGAIVIGVCDVETASGMSSPARDAGLAAGDVITMADGTEVNGLEDLLELVKKSEGRNIEIEYSRDDQTQRVSVKPALDRTLGEYRMGVWVRDSTAGIGTITYLDANTKQFGGLGHGINDSSTGKLMPFRKGSIVDVTVTGVVKGRKSIPGELKGDFGTTDIGTLYANTDVGVFGTFEKLPDGLSKPVPVADASELHVGEATVHSEVDGRVREYKVEIEELYTDSGNTKNFLIHVTDERLLEKTGGIVQGMSGSPILQNGKLVGAVTHVLVNDPTRGFGIRIENMLAEMDARS